MIEWSNVMLPLIGLAVVGLLYFLLPPLLILSTQHMDASPEITPYDPESANPPRSAAQFFDACATGLAACGFRRLESVVLPNPSPNVLMVLELYAHDANRDTAMTTALFGTTSEGPPLQIRIVEFMSEFSDDEIEMLLTNNNRDVGAFADRGEAPTFRLPQLDDLGRLYQAHQALVEQHARGARKHQVLFDRFDGDVVEYLRTSIIREAYQWQVERGVLRYDAQRDCYVPTFVGAYKMAWRIMWPFKQLIRARYDAQGRRLERELLD